jgi:hypothetical protein
MDSDFLKWLLLPFAILFASLQQSSFGGAEQLYKKFLKLEETYGGVRFGADYDKMDVGEKTIYQYTLALNRLKAKSLSKIADLMVIIASLLFVIMVCIVALAIHLVL